MDEHEQVEKVARALARKARVSEMEANGFNGVHLSEYVEICWRDHIDRARAAIAVMSHVVSPNIEKRLVDALRAIAAHEVVAPLAHNDDNVSLSDLPFYVAGKAYAELGILHNIAYNALAAYDALDALRPSMNAEPRFFIDHGQIHDRVTGKHVTTDEDTVFCDGINHCLALLNELAAQGRPSLSPELIDKLSKLATYLTEQGEYEACDLIDTVVVRLTPPPGAKP